MKKKWNRTAFIELFKEESNIEEAMPMRQYMRNQFPFLGIRSPKRNDLLKYYFSEYELPTENLLREEVKAIFDLKEREFQYVAIIILDRRKKVLTIEDLAYCEQLIIDRSWWDTIDAIAPKIVGDIVLKNRKQGEEIMKEWSRAHNLWLNRSAILHQLKYKDKMNEGMLFSIIEEHLHSDEFFIQKAIGWVLREYAKTNSNVVRDFVAKTTLKPLSEREALKNIR